MLNVIAYSNICNRHIIKILLNVNKRTLCKQLSDSSSPINKDLLGLLVCPLSKGPLVIEKINNEDVLVSHLAEIVFRIPKHPNAVLDLRPHAAEIINSKD